jgi:hypothetical protein
LGTEETRNSVNKEKGEKRVERIIKTPLPLREGG